MVFWNVLLQKFDFEVLWTRDFNQKKIRNVLERRSKINFFGIKIE